MFSYKTNSLHPLYKGYNDFWAYRIKEMAFLTSSQANGSNFRSFKNSTFLKIRRDTK